MSDSTKIQSVCKHCGFTEAQHPNSNTSFMGYPHVFEPVSGNAPNFSLHGPEGIAMRLSNCSNIPAHQRVNIVEQVLRLQAGAAPKVEETKYKLALKWIKMLWKYGEFTGACGSALREDGELKELLREADRIG